MSALAAGRVIVQLFGIRLFCSDMGMNWDVKQVAPKKIFAENTRFGIQQLKPKKMPPHPGRLCPSRPPSQNQTWARTLGVISPTYYSFHTKLFRTQHAADW